MVTEVFVDYIARLRYLRLLKSLPGKSRPYYWHDLVLLSLFFVRFSNDHFNALQRLKSNEIDWLCFCNVEGFRVILQSEFSFSHWMKVEAFEIRLILQKLLSQEDFETFSELLCKLTNIAKVIGYFLLVPLQLLDWIQEWCDFFIHCDTFTPFVVFHILLFWLLECWLVSEDPFN